LGQEKKILYINSLPMIVLSFVHDQNVWDEEEGRWEKLK